ncbi:MAG TPA: anhydro-N-acetylmuramic acid kinase [Sphingobacteriaceae bacterium]|nr:anhydro-N-acetylmuramic acid kinase [Sphingobacteriaceae bacterium]
MNPTIEQLYKIANKESRTILGLMSGTSLDGLDLALCKVKGSGKSTELTILKYETIEYSPIFRNEIKSISSKEEIHLKKLCVMNAKIAIHHANLINETLKKWNISPTQVDLIASHGQTVYHAPRNATEINEYPNSTLQIGDGDHIAVLTGIITISDFRQKHIAAGGEGAPLVVYGDYLLFSHPTENRIMLNIGGIANFTFLPAKPDLKDLISTDVGPGNTLMDQYMQEHFNLPYDKDGVEAARGKVSIPLLESLTAHPFFDKEYPKTTGPEEFNLNSILLNAKKDSQTEILSHQDTLATLIAFTSYGIKKAIKSVTKAGYTKIVIYASGGGSHNPVLMKKLEEELPEFSIQSTTTLGMPIDAKEAALFALLANETLAGEPINFPENTGTPTVCMGKISLPK